LRVARVGAALKGMLKAQKRWGAAGLAVLLVGGATLFWRHRHAGPAPYVPDEPAKVRERWRGFEAGVDVPGTGGSAGARPDWTSKQVTPEQVTSAMSEWRRGILEKRAELVVTLDQVFSLLPGRYGPELLRLAETDPDERVRAFSTRVLGKMKNVELVDVFQRLLADKSEFVRQNAAWALGELAHRPGGREAALAALDELRQAQDDPATAVRAAATNALKALQ
jgi:hypothetical protein